jgi:hypothetical protein
MESSSASMKMADRTTLVPGSKHEACLRQSETGWSVCATAWARGVATVVTGMGRVRVVLAEPTTRARPTGMATHTRVAVSRLLAADLSAKESLEALRLLTSKQFGSRKPGPSLALLDLYSSGKVQVAGRITPSALYVPKVGPPRSYPMRADETAVALELASGDALTAYSTSFVELIPTDVLAQLPDQIRLQPDPCQLRDAIAELVGEGPAARPNVVPPVAFISRT